MLIIIDGVDLTGKSTLTTRLANEVCPPAAVIRNLGPPTTGSSWLEYATCHSGYRPGLDDVVVDRSFPSEYVWPKLWGRETDMSLELLRETATYLDNLGAVHVHAMRDYSKLRIDLEAAPDEPLQLDHLFKAIRLYDEVYSILASMGCLVMVWDYDKMGDTDVQEIVTQAREASLRAAKGTRRAG